MLDADGLLVRAAGAWHWADGLLPEDEELLVSFLCPLGGEQLGDLFGDSDPWRRSRGVARLASFLCGAEATARRVDEPSRPARQGPDPPDAMCRADVVPNERRRGERCLRVPRPCRAGALLLRERAVAAVLWDARCTRHCHHCLRRIETLSRAPDAPAAPAGLRCGPRCGAVYCGEDCAGRARRGAHGVLCGSRFEALAPRTCILCVRALHADEPRAAKQLLALQDHADRMGPSLRSQLRLHAQLGAAVIGELAARAGRPARPAAAELEKLLRISLTNVFAVRSDGGRNDGGRPDGGDAIGEALFATASRIDHSCEPNCTLRLDGRSVEVRAAAPLGAGDDVLTSYGPQCGYDGLESRRERLRATHYFWCRCTGCEREERFARAPGGSGAEADAAEAADAADAADAALSLRSRAEKLDGLARRACEAEQWAAAARLTDEAVGLLRRVFPRGCTQIAHEESKLGRLLFNASADAAAARALLAAAASLEGCYGAGYDEVDELRRLASMCHDS